MSYDCDKSAASYYCSILTFLSEARLSTDTRDTETKQAQDMNEDDYFCCLYFHVQLGLGK